MNFFQPTFNFYKGYFIRFALFSLILLGGFTGYTQDYTDMYKINLTNNIPPLPNSAAIVRSAEIAMKGNTGVPGISYPIYTIKTEGISVPIVLSYNASGIKVNQLASWVGLGWSLSAGGVITREIKGSADESEYVGYCYGGGTKLYEKIIAQATSNGNSVTYSNVDMMSILAFSGPTYDGEPDVYHFSFGNYSGKFIMDKDNNVIFIPKTNLKIEIARALVGSSNNIVSFTITDENGNKYIFDMLEKTQKKVTSFQTWLKNYCFNFHTQRFMAPVGHQTYDNPTQHTIGWYLSKIETPDNESILFNYEIDEPSYTSHTNEKYYYRKNCRYNLQEGGFYFDTSVIAKDFTWIHTLQPRITTITWKGGIVQFVPTEGNREDISGLSAPPSLKQIFVKKTITNETVITASLTTSYFENIIDPDHVTHPDLFKRLRLDGLTINDQKYSFGYDQQTMPMRLSHEVDYWGYYKKNQPNPNPAVQSAIDTYIARPYVWVNESSPAQGCRNNDNGIYVLFSTLANSYFTHINGTDRSSDETNMQAGILKTITLPTGGTTSIQYEKHSFLYNNHSLSGGGLRVKKITEHDAMGLSPDVVKTYTYMATDPINKDIAHTSGICLALPKLCKRDVYIESNVTLTCGVGVANVNIPSHTHDYTTRFLDSQTDYGVFNGNAIVYSEITEGLSDGSEIVRKYEVDADISHYYQDYLGKSFSVSSMPGYVLFTGYEWLQDHYPPIPAFDLDWCNSVLKEELLNDSDGNPVKKTIYNYVPNSGNEVFYAIKVNSETLESFQEMGEPATYNDLRWGVYGYYTNWYRLFKKTEENYFYSNNTLQGKVVTDHIYGYNSVQLLKSEETVDSFNRKKRTHFLYTSDYNIINSSDPFALAIKKMKDNHIFTPIVEQYNVLLTNDGDKVTFGKFLQYKTIKNNLAKPVEEYNLEILEPLGLSVANNTGFVPSYFDVVTGEIKHNSNYVVRSIFSYNTNGKLSMAQKTNDILSIYGWGYDNTYPIAETKNATTTECGHTGFENNESNSFPIPGYAKTDFVTDPFTGKKSLKVTSEYGPGTSFEVGDNAQKHCGYKASCWVKGSTDAYLHIEVDGVWGTNNRATNPANDGLWHLLEVELPRIKIEPYFDPNLKIKVYTGGNGTFDDLRFYPMDAQMTTYTYEPLIGITSASDANNKPTFYNYDPFNRLSYVKDHQGNILKKYDYHYKTP